MRVAIVAVALLAGAMPALAALPPQYQRQAELQAVIEAATEAFGVANPVDAVSITDTDLYSVKGGACSATARIVDVPRADAAPGFAGPRNFSVQLSGVRCR